MPSSTLRVPLESLASQFTVAEIDSQGSVTLQPQLSAQEEMAQQIGQLWDTYNNFQGLPTTANDTDSESSPDTDTEEPPLATVDQTSSDKGADMDAYAVRAKVHEQLTLAQSEIQVSLDMVRLLLAAKKRVARGDTGPSDGLLKHDQATGSTAFAALVGGDIGSEVTVGGLPFPVGMVDTVKTERRAQLGAEQQQSELKFVLGAKYRQMGEAADTLLMSSQRLQTMVRGESGFWRTTFELRRRNWVIQQQQQLLGPSARRMAYGDRYFVRYGYADAGSLFSEDGLAEILRSSDDAPVADDSDVVMQSPESPATQVTPTSEREEQCVAPVFIPGGDRRRLQVRLFADELGGSAAGLAESSEYCGADANSGALDRTHGRLLSARRALFDRELYHRLCKEARVLDLGSVRSAVESSESLVRDILVTTLGRDNMDVRFEWMLDTATGEAGDGFVAWQSEFCSGLALAMASMYQRRLHREVKQFYLGANLSSRSQVSAGGRVPLPPPDAFVNVPVAPPQGAATPSGASEAAASGGGSPAGPAEAVEAAAVGSTFSVARPDLLILAPVLQGMQFAKWQHILSAHTQRACAAWRQLIGEPIEVITHFARSYQAPDGELSARDAQHLRQLCLGQRPPEEGAGEGMAYVIRMRFQGGSIMAFRVDSLGNLVFIKGYFPPSDPVGSRVDQISIHRVFRIIPMAGLPEFVDQLRREMQSLVLLRVASALSKCSYERSGTRCQMGQWYVHQAQLCAVGECWEGARHRQIIGVPCWNRSDSGVPAVGLGDSADAGAWRLSLAFGPKHPTAFDALPHLTEDGPPRIPWTCVYPPIPGSPVAEQISHLKTFEERILQVLVNSL
ncbi:hypothetical protein H4218_002177 [Coemansia sp. IMI 209128]|nr:hypothetical protein GGI10_002544 [Coemansia sp. RSA 2530]KAJ2700184.1 hypothetical protein H4218_002177 [Coemansia sp. IMI 209128]